MSVIQQEVQYTTYFISEMIKKTNAIVFSKSFEGDMHNLESTILNINQHDL